MKLKFQVNLAEALRRGIDCSREVVTIEVDPTKLTEAQRDLLAERMDGSDVFSLMIKEFAFNPPGSATRLPEPKVVRSGYRLVASAPSLAALIEAVETDAREIATGLQEIQKSAECN